MQDVALKFPTTTSKFWLVISGGGLRARLMLCFWQYPRTLLPFQENGLLSPPFMNGHFVLILLV